MSGGNCGTSCDSPLVVDDTEVAVVLSGALADLQRAMDRLAGHDIDAGIVNVTPESGPGSSCCSPKLCLVVAKEDVAAAFAVFDAEWKRGLSEEQRAALEAASQVVIDPEAAEMTCPACLTTFATGPSECPDCGLALGL